MGLARPRTRCGAWQDPASTANEASAYFSEGEASAYVSGEASSTGRATASKVGSRRGSRSREGQVRGQIHCCIHFSQRLCRWGTKQVIAF